MVRRYLFALAIAGCAIALRFSLDSSLGKSGFAVSLTGMLLAAWVGGLGPALICQTVILLADSYWYAPSDKPGPMTLQGVVSLIAFYSVGGIVGFLSETIRASYQRLINQQRETWAEREKLLATFSCVGDGLIVTDAEGRITLMNPVSEKMTGWPLSECTGMPIGDVLVTHAENSSQTLASPINRALRHGLVQHETNEWILTNRDGATLPVSFSASPVLSETKEIIGVVLVITDQTERRKTLQEMQDASRRKDEFLATLAHELRNPLAPISVGVELLKMAPDDPETCAEVVDTMERQTKHMVRLIDDLLDVSRITRGKVELRKTHVELTQVVQDAVEATRPLIEELKHELYVSLPDQPLVLNADPSRLTQILSNLLNNAAKYTPPGGRIELQAERVANQAVLTVSDNGIGLSPQNQESIFTMFMQARNTMERGHKGLGIGLTLVKSLVELHGGTVEVHSPGLDQGSQFRVTLPEVIIDTPAALPQTNNQGVQLNARTGRVLIVDDNDDALRTLNMMVKKRGYETLTARDGQQAVELAEQFLPDIILMDIGMPRMNGHEAAREIRRHSWGARIAMVATTGWGQEEDRRRTQEAGFDHHMVKPVDNEKLDEIMRMLLHRSQAESKPARVRRVVGSVSEG